MEGVQHPPDLVVICNWFMNVLVFQGFMLCSNNLQCLNVVLTVRLYCVQCLE